MNGFLVMVRFMMDDVPARLFATEAEAREFAENLDENDISDAKYAIATDASILCSVAIVPFELGIPMACEVVRSFEDQTQ